MIISQFNSKSSFLFVLRKLKIMIPEPKWKKQKSPSDSPLHRNEKLYHMALGSIESMEQPIKNKWGRNKTQS